MSKEKIKKKEIIITFENHDNKNVNINYKIYICFLAEY